MTHKIKRKIHIDDQVFFWVAESKKLGLYPFEAFHIRVHKQASTKSILYIDVSSYYFTISPNQIKEAIKFALVEGWQAEKAIPQMYVSKNDKGFYQLKDGKRFDFENLD